MNLVKECWTKKDILEFQEYLKTFRVFERAEWSKNLLKTDLPVLAIKTKDMKEIIKKIYDGNYISFLDLMIWEYYENAAINGFLISKIKDFDTMKKYLDIYSLKIDNWGNSDLLSFNIKGNEKRFMELAKEYVKSDYPFKRRIGLSILFNFINSDINEIFKIMDGFYDEEEYYVNMMNAWLLCECFIKQRDETIKYLKHNKLNKFVINKGIQKCRESYRVSVEDKELLKKYKIK